jgi:hypothetical protein
MFPALRSSIAKRIVSGLSSLDQQNRAFQAYALVSEQATGVPEYEPYQ